MKKTKKFLIIVTVLLLAVVTLTACNFKKEYKEPTFEPVDSMSVFDSVYKSLSNADLSVGVLYDIKLNLKTIDKEYTFTLKAGGDIKNNANSKMVMELMEVGKAIPEFGMYYENEVFYFDVQDNKFYISDLDLAKILKLAGNSADAIINHFFGQLVLGLFLPKIVGPEMQILEKNGVQTIQGNLSYSGIQSAVGQLLDLAFPGGSVPYDDILNIPGISAALKNIMNQELKDMIVALFDGLPSKNATIDIVMDHGVLTKFNVSGEEFKSESANIKIITYNTADGSAIDASMPEFVNYTKFDFAVYEFVTEFTIVDSKAKTEANKFIDLRAVIQLNLDVKNNDKNKVVIEIKNKKDDETLLKLYYLEGKIYFDASNAVKSIEDINVAKLGLPYLKATDVFNLSEVLDRLVGDMLAKIKDAIGTVEENSGVAPVSVTSVSDSGEITTEIDTAAILVTLLNNMILEDGKINLHLENKAVKSIISKLLGVDEVVGKDVIDVLDKLSEKLPVKIGYLMDGLLKEVGLSVEQILNGIGINGEFSVVEKNSSLGIDIIFKENLFGSISLAITDIGSLKKPLPILTAEEISKYKEYKTPEAVNFTTTLTIPNTPFVIDFAADIDRTASGEKSMLRGVVKYDDGVKKGSFKFVYETKNGEIFLDFTEFKNLLPSSIDLAGLGFPKIRITAEKFSESHLPPNNTDTALMDQIIAIVGTLINGMEYNADSGILDLTFIESGISKILESFGITLSDIDNKLGDLIGDKGLDFVQKYLGKSVYEFVKSIMPIVVTISTKEGNKTDISVMEDITIASFTDLYLSFDEPFVLENKDAYTQADLSTLEWISVQTEGTIKLSTSEDGDKLIKGIINKLIGSSTFLGDIKVAFGEKNVELYVNFGLALNIKDLSKSQLTLSIEKKSGGNQIAIFSVKMDGDIAYIDLKGDRTKSVKVKFTDMNIFGETPAQFYSDAYNETIASGNDLTSFALTEILGESAWNRLVRVIYDIIGIENTEANKLSVEVKANTTGTVRLTAKIGEKMALEGELNDLTAAYTSIITMSDKEKSDFVPLSLNPEENIATMLPVIIPMIMPEFAIRMLNNSAEAGYDMSDTVANKVEAITDGFRIHIDPKVTIDAIGGIVKLTPKLVVEIKSSGITIKLAEIINGGGDIALPSFSFDSLFGNDDNGFVPPIYDKTTGQVGQVKYPDPDRDELIKLKAPRLLANAFNELKNTFTYYPEDTEAKIYEYRVYYPNRKVFDTGTNRVGDTARDDAYRPLKAIGKIAENADGSETVTFDKRSINLLETYEVQVRAAGTAKKMASDWSAVLFEDAGGIEVKTTEISSITDGIKVKLNLDALMLQKMTDNIQASLIRGMLEGVGQYATAAKYHDLYAHYGTYTSKSYINDFYSYLSTAPGISTAIGLLSADSVKELLGRLLPFGRIVDIAYLEVQIKNGMLSEINFVGGKADENGAIIQDKTKDTDNIIYKGKVETIIVSLIGKPKGSTTGGIDHIDEIPNAVYDATNLNSIKWENGKYLAPAEFTKVYYTTPGQTPQNAKIIWNKNDLAKIKVVVGEKAEYEVGYEAAGVRKVHKVTIDATYGLPKIDKVEATGQKEIIVPAYIDNRTEKMLPSTVELLINGELKVPYPVKWDISSVDFGIAGGKFIATADVMTTNGVIKVEQPITVQSKTITVIEMLSNGASGDYTTIEKQLPVNPNTVINIDAYKPYTFKGYSKVTFSDGTTAIAAGNWDISNIKYTSIGGTYTVTYQPKYFLTSYVNEKVWTEKEYPIISYKVNIKAHTVTEIDGFVREGDKFVLNINDSRNEKGFYNELIKYTRLVTYDDGCKHMENIVWSDVSELGWKYEKGQYDDFGNVIKKPDFVGKNTYGIKGQSFYVHIEIKDFVLKNIRVSIKELNVTAIDGFTNLKYSAANPFNKDFMSIFKPIVNATISNDGYSYTGAFTAVWDLSAINAETSKVYGLGGKKYIVPVTLTTDGITYGTVNVEISFPDVQGKTFTLHNDDDKKTELKELSLNPNDPNFAKKIPSNVLVYDGTNYYKFNNVIWTKENGLPYMPSIDKGNGTFVLHLDLNVEDKKVSFALTVSVVPVEYFIFNGKEYDIAGPNTFFVNPYNAPANMTWSVSCYDSGGIWLFDETITWKIGDFNLKNTDGGTLAVKHIFAMTKQEMTLDIVVYKASFEAIKVGDEILEGNIFKVNPLLSLENKLPRDFIVVYNLSTTDGTTDTFAEKYEHNVTDFAWTFTDAQKIILSNYLDGGEIVYTFKTHEYGKEIEVTLKVEKYGALVQPELNKDKTHIIGTKVDNKVESINVDFADKKGVVASLDWGIIPAGLTSKVFENIKQKYSLKVGDTLLAPSGINFDYKVHFVTLLTPNFYEVAGGDNNNSVYYNDKGELAKGALVLPTSASMLYLDETTKSVLSTIVNLTTDQPLTTVGSNARLALKYLFDVTTGNIQYKGEFGLTIFGADNFTPLFTVTTTPYTIWKNTVTEDATYKIDFSDPTTFFATSFPVLYYKKTTGFDYNTTPNLNYKVVADAILKAYYDGRRATVTVNAALRIKVVTGLFQGSWLDVEATPLSLTIYPLPKI